jgi:cold shock protein
MASGVVKKFDDDRGFGFIRPDDGSRDVFLHVSQLRPLGLGSVLEGTTIHFDVEPGDKGPRAVNVKFPG